MESSKRLSTLDSPSCLGPKLGNLDLSLEQWSARTTPRVLPHLPFWQFVFSASRISFSLAGLFDRSNGGLFGDEDSGNCPESATQQCPVRRRRVAFSAPQRPQSSRREITPSIIHDRKK
jgi:hypothetical protein